MSAVKVENLKFGFNGREILSDVNFSAKSGEFVGILGPNGCGKSTFLKNILKILRPQSGSISLFERSLGEYSLKQLAKTLGFVPQKSVLSAPLTVEEIVFMGRFCHLKSQFSGYDKSDKEKVENVMSLLGLTQFSSRMANSLSGGEFQRVLLARAIVSEPKILLLDEPTSALDLNFSVEILKLIKSLTKQLNLLSIAVLHDLNLAALFCERVVMIKGGKIAYDGSPKELYTKEILKEIYGLNCDIIEHNSNVVVVPLKE